MSLAPIASIPEPAARPWAAWRNHFQRNRRRPLPPPASSGELPITTASALAWSLARFQIGETGEGRIVGAVARCTMAGVDDEYRVALALFIAEEGRHARILAGLVRALGGQLLASSWPERAFVRLRRLAGIRTKLLAMFAAEVIGIGFYEALAAALPPGPSRGALRSIAADERAHFAFHRRFFRRQAPGGWRRALFLAAWIAVASAAGLVVLWDHRHAMSALGVSRVRLARRLAALVRRGTR
jgi:hypothetical protein